MNRAIFFATAAALSLAACGDGGGSGVEATGNDVAATDNMTMANDIAMANDTAPAPMMMGADFVNAAAASDAYEIESSKLAAEKAQRADVKTFAQMLVADHEKSTAELKTAAATATPQITPNPAMNAEQTANMEALRAAAPADFDRVYLAQQVPAHEKALAMLQSYSAGGDIPAVKEWAGKTAGPVGMHLERARALSQAAPQ